METIRLLLAVGILLGLGGVWFWVNRGKWELSKILKRSESRLALKENRWINQKTGVGLLEVDGERFMLAYTVGGGLAWQRLDLNYNANKEDEKKTNEEKR